MRAGGRVYTAITSPAILLLIVLGFISLGGVAARSTRWTPRIPEPMIRTRAAGQILRTAWGLFLRHRRLLLGLGAIFLPAAILESALQGAVLAATPLGSLVETAGNRSLVSAAAALLVAGVGHLIATALVLGGVAASLTALESRRVGVREGYRILADRIPSILGVLALATAVTVALSLTVVGIPFAIRQLGRWAVAVQVAATEGLGPRAAHARSRALVQGRGWRTASLSGWSTS